MRGTHPGTEGREGRVREGEGPRGVQREGGKGRKEKDAKMGRGQENSQKEETECERRGV